MWHGLNRADGWLSGASMRAWTRVGAIVALAAALSVAIAINMTGNTVTAAEAIRVLDTSVVSEFPDGMRFTAQVEGDHEIAEVAVRFRIGQQTRGAYEYLEFEQATLVDSELFYRTDTSARYIPPGTIIRYNFEIVDAEGNEFATEPTDFIYFDARFEWEEVEDGPIAVAYHGPVKTRAEIILDAIIETLGHMGPLLGADTTIPIRVTMYNNVKEMLAALPPGSTTIRRELITEGQAFTRLGTLLVLGGGRGATGTASHEVTHILTHRAGDSVLRRVPSWLNEGLSEYGNIDPGFSYDIALEFALATDRLLPITSMPVLPSDPEDVIIFYGQASSVVRFMVTGYGPDAMRELMAEMKSGTNVNDAIEKVYGVTRVELENQWRDTLGASEYVPPERDRVLPTPVPRRNIQLFTLTPQAGSETIATLVVTPTATPGPTVEPTQEPAVEPTSTPEAPAPIPPASTPPPAVAKAIEPEPTAPPSSGSAGIDDDSPDQGASCSVPGHTGGGLSDLTMPAFLLGLVGLGLRRRRR